jgi:hypothetical protein
MLTVINEQTQIDIKAAIVSNSLYGTQRSFQYFYVFQNIVSGSDLEDSFLKENITFTLCPSCNKNIKNNNQEMFGTTDLNVKTTTTPSPSLCYPNPCLNGGLCTINEKKQKYLCSCREGFTGK